MKAEIIAVGTELLMGETADTNSGWIATRMPELGIELQWVTTVAEEKANNIHVGQGKTKDEFVKFRTERDATLAMPRLIIPSLQVNMRAGDIPTDKDGRAMLKVPVNGL